MPQPKTKGSIWTYQETDGDNTTIIGVDNSYKVGDNSLTAFTGIGFDYNDKTGTKKTSAVIDVKGNFPYGDSCLSGGFRLRNKWGEDTQATQLRVQPMNVNIPVSSDANFYATPYFVAKQNWKSGNFDPVVGVFAGVSYKIPSKELRNPTVSAEVQYDRSLDRASDIGNGSRNSYSFNIGVSIPLFNN